MWKAMQEVAEVVAVPGRGLAGDRYFGGKGGVPLNHLVGREFRVGGEVRLRGIRLCEPCEHLERRCGVQVRPGLAHRGGLRAQILAGGTIRVGEEINEIAPLDWPRLRRWTRLRSGGRRESYGR